VPHLPADQLTDFATRLLTAAGLSPTEAALVAESLVAANLRGHDSHGVMRIPYYVAQVEARQLAPGAEFEVLKETATLLAADGHWGFGQVQARRLLERMIEKAPAAGMAIGTLLHSGHVGRLGEYCELAAAAGLVSMMMVNTHGAARRVAPPGGIEPRLGTNPLAFGVPRDDAPLIVDFGTSATAEGKVRVKKIAGEKCPDGWLLDSQGRSTNDPNDLYADPPGTIRPMGGDQPYKGFALGLVVEIFAGALAGGPCIRAAPLNQIGNCVFMLLIDPKRLCGRDHFQREVADLDRFVRDCPRAEGVDRILLPGDPERHTLAVRSAEGIPLDDGNWRQLLELADRLECAAPPV